MASELMNDWIARQKNTGGFESSSYDQMRPRSTEVKVEDLERRIKILRYESRHDMALTKCRNKLAFDEDIEKIRKSPKIGDSIYRVAAFSVDLRYINEKEGRKKGDEALIYAAECLSKHFEYVYRIGGEKFNVITAGEWNKERLGRLCEHIVSEYSGKSPLQIYAGVVSSDEECGDLPDNEINVMVERAVSRMYADKKEKDFKGHIMGRSYDEQQHIIADAAKGGIVKDMNDFLPSILEQNLLIKELEDKKAEVERKRRELKEKEAEISGKEKDCHNKMQSLSKKESDIGEKIRYIELKTIELESAEQELLERENAVNMRRDSIEQLDADIRLHKEAIEEMEVEISLKHNEAIAAMEAEAEAKQKQLQDMDKALDEKKKLYEQQLDNIKDKVTEKQNAFIELEGELRERDLDIMDRQNLLGGAIMDMPPADISLIPGTEAENGVIAETVSTKFLSTMWFYTHSISCTVGKEFHDIKFWVFPIRYVRPVVTMPSVVIMQVDNGVYCVREGTNITHYVDGKEFTLNCRIQRDGSFQSAVIVEDECINIISHEQDPHVGKYTPKLFGKTVIVGECVYEVFPIKQNINGTCDCVIGIHSLDDMKSGSFHISDGMEEIDGKKFSFVLSDDRFEVVIDE